MPSAPVAPKGSFTEAPGPLTSDPSPSDLAAAEGGFAPTQADFSTTHDGEKPAVASSKSSPSEGIKSDISSKIKLGVEMFRAIKEDSDEDYDDDDYKAPLLSLNLDPEAIEAADETFVDHIVVAVKESSSSLPEDSAATAFLGAYKTPDDHLSKIARLLAAASYRVYGAAVTARIDQAEFALGGNMFDEDIKAMAAARLSYDEVQPMEEVDRACLGKAKDLNIAFDKQQHKPLKTSVPDFVKCEATTTQDAVKTRVTAEIRASAKDTVGYCMGHPIQFYEIRRKDVEDIRESEILIFGRTPRHYYTKSRLYFPYPLSDRELLNIAAWEKVNENEYFVGTITTTHPDHPVSPGCTRITMTRAITITALKPNISRITVTTVTDLGGNVPLGISNSLVLPQQVDTPLNMMNCFASLRNQFDEGDAEELGQLIIINLYGLHPHLLHERLAKCISRISVLRRAQAKYRFLDELLYHVLRNQLVKAAHVVQSPLSALASRDAALIGKSMGTVLMSNVTASSAVDEWILMYPALVEFEDESAWFRPMMNGIGRGLMKKAMLGLVFRAYTGAFFSMLDMASDSYIITIYFLAKADKFAWGLVAMVCLNLVLQLCVVFMQTRGLREGRWTACFTDWLYIITFTKPGVDAWRVCSGAGQRPGEMLSPLDGMIWSKNAEIFCEAIPGMVIQAVALISSKQRTPAMYFSLLMSACSAALISTNTAYDIDTDPQGRIEKPDSFGMVPNTSRGAAFATMFVLALLQILAKCLGTALMIVTNMRWLLYYMVCDHGLMFAFKLVQRDFIYWTPMPLAVSIVFTVCMRAITKTITDYSASLVSRVPVVMGGAYWLFNFIQNQASVLLAVYLYNTHAEDNSVKLSAFTTWALAVGLVAASLATFLVFVFRIAVVKFRSSFWSTLTGCQYVENIFLKSDTDERRKVIFFYHVAKWERIRGDVKAWTHARWGAWVTEEPAWFTPLFVAGVPDEFIPPEFLNRMGGQMRQRRGSAAASVRESMRAMSLRAEEDPEEKEDNVQEQEQEQEQENV
jgi:hypothetical protein